jgi:putative transposase
MLISEYPVVRAPQANAFCERLIGTIRRECLDFVIPLNERHVRRLLREWVAHYNRGPRTRAWDQAFPIRRTMALASCSSGHQIPDGHRVVAAPLVLGRSDGYRACAPPCMRAAAPERGGLNSRA